jgi:DNA-binding response OmpR family regulator
MIQKLCRTVLERDGHTVVSESSGLLGRSRALADLFELIVTDINLPGLDGFTVCADLRKAGVRSPMIALTVSDAPDEIARGREVGFDRYITKPISAADLREAVHEFDGGTAGGA